MAQGLSEVLEWLGQVEVIKNQLQKDPQCPRASLMQTLNVKKGRLSYLYKINACFDQQALNRVRQAAQSTPPAFVPFGNARALADLGDKIPKPYEPVHEALEVVISNQITLPQIEALVARMAGGKPAKDFDLSKAKTISTPVGRSPLADSADSTTQPQEKHRGQATRSAACGSDHSSLYQLLCKLFVFRQPFFDLHQSVSHRAFPHPHLHSYRLGTHS